MGLITALQNISLSWYPQKLPPQQSFFTVLPPHIISAILRLVIMDEGDLCTSLLKAYPELGKHILVVTDDTKTLKAYTSGTEMKGTTLESLQRDTSISDFADCGLKVFYYSYAEDACLTERLTGDVSCPYAQFLTRDSVLFVKTYTTRDLAFELITECAAKKGVNPIHIPILSDNYVELDGRVDVFPTSEDPITIFITARMDNPMLRARAHRGPFTFDTWHRIETIDVRGYTTFGHRLAVAYATSIRVRIPNTCSPNTSCFIPNLALYAPYLLNLYVSFEGAFTPRVWCNDLWTKTRSTFFFKELSFTLVNTNWSLRTPQGRSCCHGEAVGIDQAHYRTDMVYQPFDIVLPKDFNRVNLVGVSDVVLKSVNVCNVLSLTWKRLVPTVGSEPILHEPLEVDCFLLTELVIFDKFEKVSAENSNLLPSFCAPKLEELCIVVLDGSHECLPFADTIKGSTTDGTSPCPLTSITLINLQSMSGAGTTHRGISWRDIGPFTKTVEVVNAVGFDTSLLLSKGTNMSSVFASLKSLRIDVSILAQIQQADTETIDIPILPSIYPQLETLILDVLNDSRSGLLSEHTLSIKIPLSVTLVCVYSLIQTKCTGINEQEIKEPVDSKRAIGMYHRWVKVDDEYRFDGLDSRENWHTRTVSLIGT